MTNESSNEYYESMELIMTKKNLDWPYGWFQEFFEYLTRSYPSNEDFSIQVSGTITICFHRFF